MMTKDEKQGWRVFSFCFGIIEYIIFFTITANIILPHTISQCTMSHEEAYAAYYAGTCTYFTYQIDTVVPVDEPEKFWSIDGMPATYLCDRGMSAPEWLYVYALLYITFKLISMLIRAIGRRLIKWEE